MTIMAVVTVASRQHCDARHAQERICLKECVRNVFKSTLFCYLEGKYEYVMV